MIAFGRCWELTLTRREHQKRNASVANSGDPVSAVQQYIAAFNKGDARARAAVCANPMSILDGMAPHVWHGATATEDWYRDVLTEGEHLVSCNRRK